MNYISKIVRNPDKVMLYLMEKGILNWMNDKTYLKIKYKLVMGKKLNIDNPKDFNEKLQWLKLYDRRNEYTAMVDKYEAKKYIEKKIGQEYIIKNFGVWDKFEDIDFDKLPNEFVLKPTHTSGNVFICKDKSKIDYKKLKKEVRSWLKRKYYYIHREWPYKNVKPRIIAEEYMAEVENSDLLDYKFMCFNGKVKCSFICSERRSKEGVAVDFYDCDWNHMPFKRHYRNANVEFKKPKNYEMMIRLAEQLAENIPFVRIDFYEINGKIYFGEITFFPGAGLEEFEPEKYDRILGEMLELPIEKREEK